MGGLGAAKSVPGAEGLAARLRRLKLSRLKVV